MSLLTTSVATPREWGFDPRSLPDCDIWFDAADTATITGTSPVTVWANKGSLGSAANATNDVGTCTSGGGTINGLNFVSSPAGTQLAFTCALTSQARSWFIVMRGQQQTVGNQFCVPIFSTPGNAGQDRLFIGKIVTTDYFYNLSEGFAGTIRMQARVSYPSTATNGGMFASPIPNQFGTPRVYSFVNSDTSTANNIMGVNGFAYRSGTNPATLAINTLASGYATTSMKYTINTTIASEGTTTYNTGMDLCEIIHYNRAVTNSERMLIEGYLAWKWGLVNVESSFLPTSIPSCAAWYDADVRFNNAPSRATSFTFSAGNTIATWLDKSGNNRTATTSTAVAGRATLALNALNGKCGVAFGAGAATALISPLSLGTTQSFSVFIVANSVTFSSLRYACSVNGIPATQDRYLAVGQSAANPGIWISTGGSAGTAGFTTGATLATTRADIVCTTWNATQNITYVNGLPYDASTATPPSLTVDAQLIIGGIASVLTPVNTWAGNIYEVIVFTEVLSFENRTRVERYLSLKWNNTYYIGSGLANYHSHRFWRGLLRSFNPVDYDPVLWLDGSDQKMVILSGSSVTQWRDKSGYANHATPQISGTTIAPTYANNGVVFAGASVLNTPLLNSLLSQMTYFIVGSVTNAAVGQDLISGNVPNGSTNRSWFVSVISGNQRTATYNGAVINTGAALTSNARFIYNGTLISAGTSIMFLNGTLTSTKTGTQTFTGIGTITIAGYIDGSNPNGAGWMGGTINEVIIYSSALTAARRQQIEGYLAWKWGMNAVVPTTHPYYLTKLPPAGFALNILQSTDVFTWLDASDPDASEVIPLPGTILTQWVDKSGYVKVAQQSTDSQCATYELDNGYPSLRFLSSAADWYLSTATLNPGATYNQLTIFVVFRPSAAANSTVFMHTKDAVASGTAASSRHAAIRTTLSPARITGFIRYNASTSKLCTSTVTSITDKCLVCLSDNGSANTNPIFWTNGTPATTVLTGGTGVTGGDSGRYVVGAQFLNGAVSSHFDGYIYEIVFITRQVGTQERTTLEGYLAWKWGLNTLLPTTHPFYINSP